jgi:hypothetical protein
VTAVFCALEFDHHKVRLAVKPQKVYAPLAFVPFAELFGDDQGSKAVAGPLAP